MSTQQNLFENDGQLASCLSDRETDIPEKNPNQLLEHQHQQLLRHSSHGYGSTQNKVVSLRNVCRRAYFEEQKKAKQSENAENN